MARGLHRRPLARASATHREEQQVLRSLIAGTRRGAGATAEQAKSIDEQCRVLEGFLLEDERVDPWSTGEVSGRWNVLYTTEKDTKSLDPFLSREEDHPIFQVVDTEAGTIVNTIRMRAGLSLSAEAPLELVRPNRIKYFFEFFDVALLGGLLKLPRIPVGSRRIGGWSDTVYYCMNMSMNDTKEEAGEAGEETLRILRNFRKDLIVLERENGASS
ncbi:hypothetical protein HOP50_19g84250 [Chloropicon primus]|uniref:Plastid lipid-associated protein/fibrillin conserved domain-containing protein n=1 Tax=Chloropicon primus TaxID=1764295 RepID=A0A5B8N005_9CHLO|nr:hypothetical protein A3770_19p83990 [Chloropicon primus]UPR05077.1 hypothetical protein HOP50_19g84250 [Chloropicon primus]|eukprot:QDZ25881.1 hypothetical protein A3770_19p83990 [Chloropicon primus]